MGSNCVSAPKCRCRPAKKKRPLCCSDSATSTPVPTGKQNNFTAVWSKLFTCVIITFLLCLLNYMGNVSGKGGFNGCIRKVQLGLLQIHLRLCQPGRDTYQWFAVIVVDASALPDAAARAHAHFKVVLLFGFDIFVFGLVHGHRIFTAVEG